MHKISFVKTAIAAFSLSIAIFAQSQDEQVSTNANSNSASGTQRTEAVDGDFILKAKTRKGSYEEMNDVFRFQILQNQNFKAELKTQNDEWGSGFPEWTSDSTRFQFSTANGVEDALGKASAATPKNQTERIEVKNQDVAKEAELVACRYILAIHSKTVDGKFEGFGHAWISIYDLEQNGAETTYGLWPYYGFWGFFSKEDEEDPELKREAFITKEKSCLLVNYELEKGYQAQFHRYYLISEDEYEIFINDLENQSNPALDFEANEDDPNNVYNYYCWTGDHSNCATYAGTMVNILTSETINYENFFSQHRPSAIADDLSNKEKDQTKTEKGNPLYDKTFYRGKNE